jgi:subfamily B ATP-binding cassette protein MsbA
VKEIRRLLPYFRPEWATLCAAYVCMILLAATTAIYASLAGPALKFIFSGNISDILRTSHGQLRSAWHWVPTDWIAWIETFDRTRALLVLPALIVATALFKGLSQTGQFYLTGRTSQRILRHLRADAFAALLRQSPSFFTQRSHGDLLSRLTADANMVEQSIFYGVAPILREPLSVLALVGFCFYIDAKLALWTFVVVPAALFPLARFGGWLTRVSHRGQDLQGDINGVCDEALSGVRVVQAYGAEDFERERLDQAAKRYLRQMKVSYFIRAVRTPTMEFLGAVALAGLLTLLGYQVRIKGADPAHFISFFVALVMMYDPLKKLGNVADYLATGVAALRRLLEIVDIAPAICDRKGARPLSRFNKSVRFERVSFAYHTEPVLTDLSLELAAGQMVALVGSSGAGKTTLAHLLPRFYDVTAGRILIDDMDIRDLTLASLRRQMSVVSQDTFLFNTSVAANIAYGRSDASRKEIVRAAEAAYADEFVQRLPHGYDSVIGERGVTLSGGQRQRLAIARALLRDAPLLILDEATSSLDVESERFVQQALDVLMRGRTSLVIAHRLSTVRRADVIAVLKGGCIVEKGRHDELIALSGEYARLYALQFDDKSSAPATVAAAN